MEGDTHGASQSKLENSASSIVMKAGKKQAKSPDSPHKVYRSEGIKTRSKTSTESTDGFKYIDKLTCLLKANSKVVHFGSAGISLQDSQGKPPNTWIHHFKKEGQNKGSPCVTLTQKSGNRFMVLTKYNDSNNLELYSYNHNGSEPDIKKLSNHLEQHLFIKHQHGRQLEFQCHNRSNLYLHATEQLSMRCKMETDPTEIQNYCFQLENKGN